MFQLFYSLLVLAAYIVAIPFLLLLPLRSKYRRSVPSRFFLWKNPPFEENGIWFHMCSYGEAKAMKPLIERFDPNLLRLSVTTQTGYEVISRISDFHSRYLPFEPLLYIWTRRQKVLVVAEAELWYLLFAVASSRGAETFLINARISDRSFPRYMRFKWLYKHIFSKIDHVYAQSEPDRKRLLSLGAGSVKVAGNIKLSGISSPSKDIDRKTGKVTVCAASTHEGEEEIILNAFEMLRSSDTSAVLVVVPRHPERFDAVYSMIEAFCSRYNWRSLRFSENRSMNADIVLMDVMGELVDCMSISDIVIMGGAFGHFGGHNAAEAAQFGCRIISGPNYFNQRELFSKIEGITICDAEELPSVLREHRSLPVSKIAAETDSIEKIYQDISDVLQNK